MLVWLHQGAVLGCHERDSVFYWPITNQIECVDAVLFLASRYQLGTTERLLIIENITLSGQSSFGLINIVHVWHHPPCSS